MKTVRFTQIVSQCGKPESYTQWLPLDQDIALKKAIKQHRLMTVHLQTTGTKKDYGEVGYVDEGQRVLLLFSKSLASFQGRRVVGIDYAQLKSDPRLTQTPSPKTRAVSKSKKASPKASAEDKSALQLFASDPEPKSAEPKLKTAPAKPNTKPKPNNKRKLKPSPAPAKKAATDLSQIHSLVAKAMKQIQSGKAVAAYQTLEQILKT